jgi:hypothetical protein
MLNSSEISLRRAVAVASKQAGSKGNIAETIRESAMGQMELIQQAQGFMGGVKDSKNLQGAAIGMAVQGLEIAYHVLSSQMQEAKFIRKQFVEECENNIATFTLNHSKEIEDFSKHEKAIDNYYQILTKECGYFLSYFGIQDRPDETNPKIHRLSILPFFKMSQALQQKSLVASQLDQHRQACSLFLKTALPTIGYDEDYRKINRIFLQLEGLWEKENYLNRFKAPRFIIISLANLLWNLLFPVDNDTGIPLTLAECVNLCLKAELFLNLILDNTQENFIDWIDDSQHGIYSFLLKIELYIKGLHQAFEFERLHEINLTDVSNSMHRALRIMANKIMELIFQKGSAAETLMGQLMLMGEIVNQSAGIVEKTFKKDERLPIPALNKVPSSTMDLLLLFIHQPPHSRTKIINRLKTSANEANQELGKILEKFYQEFLSIFEENAKKSFKKKNLPMDFHLWIGKRFIALIVMMMECFNIFEDTRPCSYRSSEESFRDKDQRSQIIEIAASSHPNRYYEWSLSIFLKNKSKTSENLDQLLHEQNKMLMMTKLLDQVGSMVLENRVFLQQPDFQAMILDCLKKIELAYKALNDRLNDVETQMAMDQQIQRHEKRVIQPMLDDLEATLECIQRSILQVSQVISDPGFSEHEKQQMLEKTAAIQAQFQTLFQDGFNLPTSLPGSPLSEVKEKPGLFKKPVSLTPKKTLVTLLQKCFDGMSHSSKQGIKGDLLIKMKLQIEKQTQLSDEDLGEWILELINITSAPRANFLFQAAYGQTRSAKVLIKAILNPRLNQDLPLAAIIFKNPCIDISTLNETKVLQQIHLLKQENSWSNMAEQLEIEPGF